MRDDLSWVLETPHDLRDQAVNQFVTAYKNAVRAHGRGNFEIAFRCVCKTPSARDHHRSVEGLEPLSGRIRLDLWQRRPSSEPLLKRMEHEFRVMRTKLGRHYLSIPVPLVKRRIREGDNQAPVAAIDPACARHSPRTARAMRASTKLSPTISFDQTSLPSS